MQYACLRIALREPPGSSSTLLHNEAKIEKSTQRIENMTTSYLKKALNGNDLIANIFLTHHLLEINSKNYWIPSQRIKAIIDEEINCHLNAYPTNSELM